MEPAGFERREAISALTDGWVSGRLSLDTFEFRVERALRASHSDQLLNLLGDLVTPWAEPALTVSLSGLPERAVFGRRPGSTVVIDDETVSRAHASLQRVESRWTLRDLDSLNGTLVNGRPVGCARVEPGDRVCLGAVTISITA